MTVEHQDPMTMSVTEAARAVGVDRRTIRRRLDGGEFPNAYRAPSRQGPESGPWLIPVGDLLQAGLQLQDPHEVGSSDQSGGGDGSEAESLRKALAEAVLRAEIAEAKAAERERVIEAQELALRSLATGVQVDGPGDLADTPDAVEGTPERDRQESDIGPARRAAAAEPSAPVPPAAQPYPEDVERPQPAFAPGAPLRPTPPWVPIPPPPPRRRWWQRKP